MSKTERLSIRVTAEEKEKIKKLAENKGMSITALVLNSIRNNITVNLNTSDYKVF